MDQAVPGVEKQAGDLQLLKKQVLHFSFFNFFLVALSGLFLRSYPFLSAPFFDFRNMVHGHSHFAFGGWVMPILIWMILQYFPVLAAKVAWHHWRNIAIITLVSAFGMLASFPFQGYALVSICFSTLSIIGSFYLAIVLIKAMRGEENKTSLRFLRAGLIYGALSAIGPFATGPLIAKGMSGTPLFLIPFIYFFISSTMAGSPLQCCLLLMLFGKRKLLRIMATASSCSSIWPACPPIFYRYCGTTLLLFFTGSVAWARYCNWQEFYSC